MAGVAAEDGFARISIYLGFILSAIFTRELASTAVA